MTARILAGLYAALVLALLAGVVSIWRLRCENFGCMGLGVAWFAWAMSYLVVLGVGLVARTQVRSAALARVWRLSGWLQGLTGAVLLLVWAARNLV